MDCVDGAQHRRRRGLTGERQFIVNNPSSQSVVVVSVFGDSVRS